MDLVQLYIRAEVKRGEFPAPKGAEAFQAYAIAVSKGLILETENAARQTLDHPMTFEIIGKGLPFFEGGALRNLGIFRQRCRYSLIGCLDSFLEARPPGPSSIWVGCPKRMFNEPGHGVPKWLSQLLSRKQKDLKVQKFSDPLDIHSRIRGEYLEALHAHLQNNCKFCLGVHLKNGSTFCAELENKLVQAVQDEGSLFWYAMIAILLGLTNLSLRKQ